ncbi:MAG: hypothetical protein FWC60_04405 [Firmicutes bacterium]|nr:hypothetical protein [Bacillota bacterium]
MKKFFALLFMLALSLTVLAGCGGKSAGSGATDNPPAASQSDNQSATPAAGDTAARVGAEGWPASTIYKVPEWKGITKYFGGGGSLDDYVGKDYMMNVVATEDSFNQYQADLKAAGYTITADTGSASHPDEYNADLGPVSITINPSQFDGANGYQVDINLAPIGKWPDTELPGFITPVKDKTLVYDPTYHPPGDSDLQDGQAYVADKDGYNFCFTVSGITQDEAVAYMKDAAAKLTNGQYGDGGVYDDSLGYIKGTYNVSGQTYKVAAEFSQRDDLTYYFTFGWSTGSVAD